METVRTVKLQTSYLLQILDMTILGIIGLVLTEQPREQQRRRSDGTEITFSGVNMTKGVFLPVIKLSSVQKKKLETLK